MVIEIATTRRKETQSNPCRCTTTQIRLGAHRTTMSIDPCYPPPASAKKTTQLRKFMIPCARLVERTAFIWGLRNSERTATGAAKSSRLVSCTRFQQGPEAHYQRIFFFRRRWIPLNCLGARRLRRVESRREPAALGFEPEVWLTVPATKPKSLSSNSIAEIFIMYLHVPVGSYLLS